jgi:hypothetical protein
LGGPVVGQSIQWASIPHALALVVNDDASGRVLALVAHLDGSVRQVAGGFKAHGLEGKGVVRADVALFLDKEEFVVGLIGREEMDAGAVTNLFGIIVLA